MADPFSVIGSAVGVVSLAITTCQGVLSYYNSWDTQDQNISDAKGEIERLRSSFSALEEILPKVSPSSAIATQVEQCVLSSKEGTGRLEQFLGKCLKNPAPLSLIDKLRVCRQKAIFPFRQSSLDSLRKTVRDLEGSLGTALQILQFDTSGVQFRQTSELVDLTKSTAVSVEGASQGILNLEQKADIIIGALPQIQQGVTQFTSDVPILCSSFTSMEQIMEQRIQAVEGFTSRILPDFQTKLDQLPLRIRETLAECTASAGSRPSVETPGINSIKSAMSTTLTEMDEVAQKLQLALAQRPSLLRTVCDKAGDLEMNVGRIPTITAQNRITQDGRKGKWTKQRSYCSCSTLIRERAATYSIGIVEFFKASVESCKHSVTCPLYIGIKATTTVGLKTAYYKRLLANTVGATVSVTAGAGGYSISPCLKFRALVPRDSPAFNLLDSRRFTDHFRDWPTSQTKEVCKYFESTLQQLYELFKDGAASPTDMDEDGRTLLNVLEACAWALYDCDIETIQSFRILIMGLVAAEVPLNETDNWGHSALNKLAYVVMCENGETRHRQKFADLVTDVSEAGAGLSKAWFQAYPYYRRGWTNVRELEMFTKFDGWIEDCNCGPLSAAILYRLENDVEQILQTSAQSIHERNFRGQSPLHLSCNRPKGVILLLRHGGKELLDRPDIGGCLPLSYSCAVNCLEAANLMLEAGSPLYPSDAPKVSPYKYGIFEEAIGKSTDEIIEHLQTALVDRRSRLYCLATTKLCRKDLEGLKIPVDRILDEKAFAVYEALERRNIPIPSALRPPLRTTLFHDTGLTPALGESLYGHGFLDVDGIDDSGLTPLMKLKHPYKTSLKDALQRASWLILKGANLEHKFELDQRMLRYPSITAAHQICSWVGRAVYEQNKFEPKGVGPEMNRIRLFGMLDDLENDCQSLFGKLVSSIFVDDCLCACSSLGCTPVTKMLRGITEGVYKYFEKRRTCDPFERRLWVIEWVAKLLVHRLEAWRGLSREIIRYETFERLGLTHTCYNVIYSLAFHHTRIDSVECEEIRDEEHLLISKLDALVAEFHEKYTELGVTVPEFLQGYWKARMEEVEREEEPLDDEEIAKIKDMGVVIHS